ncbi:MAG: amidohydrolase family protein [Gemmatimonadota bacterium]
MIIDTHTHFYDPARPQGVPWPPPASGLLYRTVLPEHHRALAAPEGVTGTVVVEASAWVEDNQWILDLATDDPWIVGLVGHVDPGTPDFAAQLRRFAAHRLFKGIRVGASPFADLEGHGFLRDMETLADLGLELDVLLGAEQLSGVGQLAHRLPELRIVINHVAHVAIDGGPPDPRWVEAMEGVAEHPQVYCKVSALVELSRVQPAPTDPGYYQPTLDALWRIFGEERLVYGSNWPVSDRAGQYQTVAAVARAYFESKGERAAARFWWRNAERAYALQL